MGMNKVDLMLEVTDMDKFYEQNEDFKRYVDANRRTYGRSMVDELESPITREYYRSLLKGGCNERRTLVKGT